MEIEKVDKKECYSHKKFKTRIKSQISTKKIIELLTSVKKLG